MRVPLAALLLVSCSTAPVATGDRDPAPPGAGPSRGIRFDVRMAAGLADTPQTGRLLVLLTTRDGDEPRNLVSDEDDTAQVFGVDVE
jgi:hypothetical protein